MDFKQFKTKLNGFIQSQKTQRDNLQELIEAALAHYAGESDSANEPGDTIYLTTLVQKCIGVKSVPTKTVTEYIKEHANVRYVKLKDGTYGFKKAQKSVPVEVNMPEVTWYAWTGGDHNTPKKDFDWEASVNRLRQNIAQKLEEGHIKKPEEASKALATLDELLAE